MLWIAIGLMILAAWSLQRAASAIGEATVPWRRRSSRGEGTIGLIFEAVVLVVTEPSPRSQRLQALLSQGARLRTWRANLMQACFADLSFWLALVALFAVMQVSGLFALSAAGFLLLATRWIGARGTPLAAAFFFMAFFLVATESALRMVAGSLAMEASGLSMWLADNRPLAVLVLTVVAAAISALLGIEFLMVALAAVGLSTGVLAINAAVALVWGERLGLPMREWWQSRGQIVSVRRMARGITLSSLAAVPVAFVLLGFVRDQFGVSQEWGLRSDGLASFLMPLIVSLIPFPLATGLWGHFAARTSVDDVMTRSSLPSSWIESTSLRRRTLKGLLAALSARRNEVDRLRAGFEAENWRQVPPPVREASLLEASHLEGEVGRLETVLSSRSDFFGHQLL